MANSKIIAINEQGVNAIMMDVLNCCNDIKVIFNRIDDLMNDAKVYYKCQSSSTLFSKYALFNNNYIIIIKSIMSYNQDLTNLKRKYAVNMEDLSNEIRRDISKMDRPLDYKERN